MRKFDYSFLDNGLLPSSVLDITNGIYSLMTATDIRKSDYNKVFSELESIARVQSVKSSNAIEGIVTSDSRIRAIVNNNSAPLNHSEAEIAGYRDALNLIHTGYNHISFSERDILLLHETMMSLSGDSSAGKYKSEDNVIVAVDSNGNRYIRFRPVAAAETKTAMEQLVLAYEIACSNSHINTLLLIPCVILDFLCIHPFRDGNGRMSRLLSLLLLYKNGFDVGKYASFEEQINKYKSSYYDSLQKSSSDWENNQNDYFPFMQNFLTTLYLCYKELNKRFAVVNGKKINKTNRIEATVLNSIVPISKAEICSIHPDISPTTVEAVLAKMMKEGQIRRIGAMRNSRYLRNEPYFQK